MSNWIDVEYIGTRTGGFTQHGDTTRPYRFKPPYRRIVSVHPDDISFFEEHPDYIRNRPPVVTPAVQRIAPTTSPQTVREALSIQETADHIKIAAQVASAATTQRQYEAAAKVTAVAQAAAADAVIPTSPPRPEHPAIVAQRIARAQDTVAKSQTPPSTPSKDKRSVGPLGNLQSISQQKEPPWRPLV